jgi:hypothetical protein
VEEAYHKNNSIQKGTRDRPIDRFKQAGWLAPLSRHAVISKIVAITSIESNFLDEILLLREFRFWTYLHRSILHRFGYLGCHV